MDSQTPSGISSEEIAHWVGQNWMPIATGIVAVGLIGLFYVYSDSSAEAREQAASNELFTLELKAGEDTAKPTAEDYRKVADQFASTGIAQHGQLLAASKVYESGNYAAAQQSYNKFVTDFSESPLLPEAFLGIAVSLDAQGNSEQALVKYREVISRFPQSSVVNRAKVNEARLLQAVGENEQAFRIYQELLSQGAENPYAQRSAWQMEAQIALQKLIKSNPELIPTNSAPAGSSISPSALDLSPPSQ
jgi:predicted negative regulator of RcsB-dependent stress response